MDDKPQTRSIAPLLPLHHRRIPAQPVKFLIADRLGVGHQFLAVVEVVAFLPPLLQLNLELVGECNCELNSTVSPKRKP